MLLSLGEKDFHLFEDYSLEVNFPRYREVFGGVMVASFDPDLVLSLATFSTFSQKPYLCGFWRVATDAVTVSKIC